MSNGSLYEEHFARNLLSADIRRLKFDGFEFRTRRAVKRQFNAKFRASRSAWFVRLFVLHCYFLNPSKR